MKNLPPSMRAIFGGHSLGAGAAETTGGGAAAAAVAVALGEVDGVAVDLFIKKKPAPPTTIAPIATPAKSPPFERDGEGDVGDATGSRVDGPCDTACAAAG